MRGVKEITGGFEWLITIFRINKLHARAQLSVHLVFWPIWRNQTKESMKKVILKATFNVKKRRSKNRLKNTVSEKIPFMVYICTMNLHIQ